MNRAHSLVTKTTAASVTALLALSGCMVGPNYVRPSAPTPTVFKEGPSGQNGWKPAEPLDAVAKGEWWMAFNDEVLNNLEKKVVINNQNVAAAEAAYRAARALTSAERASLFPTLGVTASATRSGGGGRTVTPTAGGAVSGGSYAATAYSPAVEASWAPDLWGAIRRQVESDNAAAQASAAELANATLSAQAELAADYLTLRVLDEEKRLYDRETDQYKRSLTITQNQYRAGTVAQTNFITAQAALLSVQAQDQDIGVQRAQEEHAIAMLIGVPPADLTIAPVPISRVVPVAPAGVPSTLLERRPDIAQAERTMKSENALIGVQVAAYFPSLTLSGSYGFSASNLGSLFNSANSLWSYGASAAETVLDFGARQSRVRQAKAVYEGSVASYRQTVLTAFQGVEDELAALRIYQDEASVRDLAATQAQKAADLYINQYKAGTVDYTTVVTAEATALGDAVAVLQILAERQVASVTLIEDLGGGWTQADLPKH